MKFYEKPMATIEQIEVKDVITTSGIETLTTSAVGADTLKTAAAADAAIVFEW